MSQCIFCRGLPIIKGCGLTELLVFLWISSILVISGARHKLWPITNGFA
jgi:hypothetical protein